MYSQSVVSFGDKKIPAHLYTIFSYVFIVIYICTHARAQIKDSLKIKTH